MPLPLSRQPLVSKYDTVVLNLVGIASECAVLHRLVVVYGMMQASTCPLQESARVSWPDHSARVDCT